MAKLEFYGAQHAKQYDSKFDRSCVNIIIIAIDLFTDSKFDRSCKIYILLNPTVAISQLLGSDICAVPNCSISSFLWFLSYGTRRFFLTDFSTYGRKNRTLFIFYFWKASASSPPWCAGCLLRQGFVPILCTLTEDCLLSGVPWDFVCWKTPRGAKEFWTVTIYNKATFSFNCGWFWVITITTLYPTYGSATPQVPVRPHVFYDEHSVL